MGQNIAYKRTGSGPPLLVVHGSLRLRFSTVSRPFRRNPSDDDAKFPQVSAPIEQRVAVNYTATLEPVVQAAVDDESASIDEWERTVMRGRGGYMGT